MINSVFIINNQGKARLCKFYDYLPDAQRQQYVRQVYKLVSTRDDSLCNFLEGGPGGEGTRVVYRHYATLYFVFCVDDSESELGILDLIQVFVETLDRCFKNVCELDLVFHMDKVHSIIDEIVQAGMVLETNIADILKALEGQNKHEKQTSKKVKATVLKDPKAGTAKA